MFFLFFVAFLSAQSSSFLRNGNRKSGPWAGPSFFFFDLEKVATTKRFAIVAVMLTSGPGFILFGYMLGHLFRTIMTAQEWIQEIINIVVGIPWLIVKLE